MKNKIGDNRHSVILQDAQVVDIQQWTLDSVIEQQAQFKVAL